MLSLNPANASVESIKEMRPADQSDRQAAMEHLEKYAREQPPYAHSQLLGTGYSTKNTAPMTEPSGIT